VTVDTAALTAAELADARATLLESLPDLATIRHRTSTPSGGGGQTWAFPDSHVVPCRLSPIAGGEDTGSIQTGPKKISDLTTHMLTIPHDTVIAHEDRVVVNGDTYEVTYVRRRPTWEVSRRVELREVA
jgi:hypothetical protein